MLGCAADDGVVVKGQGGHGFIFLVETGHLVTGFRQFSGGEIT
jgi:hypothetical protein